MFKKNIPLFVIIIILILGISKNNIKRTKAQEISNQIHKTILAKNIKSDFSEIEPEELIVETIEDFNSTTIVDPKYISQAGNIVPKTRINTQNNNDSNEQLFFLEHRDTLSGQAVISIESDPKNRTEAVEYIVQSGDTISGIASSFGLNVNTILWENNLGANSLIRPGSKLTILPSDGIMHIVKSNENISRIANTYNIESEKIIEGNNLESSSALKIGQKLFIPGGKKIVPVARVTTRTYSGTTITPTTPSAPQQTYTGGKLLWPTVGSRITQYYSWRHQGLDIANKTGTPLYASESGTVERSGWNSGYGYNVVVNHGGGMKTLYAHASKLHVSAGDRVNRGDIIADMGSTGWSTGPHIHFEVIVNGAKQNPLNYLR